MKTQNLLLFITLALFQFMGAQTYELHNSINFNSIDDGRDVPDGITWYKTSPLSYGIYRTNGSWSAPNFQQLKLYFDTGIIIDGGSQYGKSGTILQPNGGKVGIGTGTENPVAPLTVYGKSVIFPARIGSGDARSFVVDHTASNPAFISNNYPVVLKTGGGDQPLILDASRIGIGTSNPSKKLDIYSSSTTALKISTADPASYTTEIHLGGSADFTKSAIISAPNAAGWYRQDLFFCLANGNNTSSVGISDAAMVIKSYNSGQFGNVGIGTINPDEKLTVKGKIHTQEVRVDMTGPLVPDYVFANDYKLKSLQEVEEYIKQNSHLPEIPSAKEIEKNGLMLAEMNMNLLKKIEELTLYSIDQNKKIETQAKEIESLNDLVLRVTKIESELARK